MSKQYTYIEKKYPASPRSKRRRETGEGASLGGATVLASTSTGGVGVTDHGELSGIVSTGDEYSEFARDIHLTAADAEALKRVFNLEIIESTDEETIPTDFNIYSALKSKLEDDKRVTEMEEKFIRKDKPDGTDYLLTARGGINIGDFISGLLGSGARINEKGEIEARSLQLWELLNVPELRFNRVDVIAGETWECHSIRPDRVRRHGESDRNSKT